MPSSHLILCCPLLLLPSIPPSIRVFSNESTLHIRWPKYWSFTFSISPCNEHPGLISFRLDWVDLLAVQGTLKSLLQHHSSKASILQCSAFFTVQLSHPYMTTGKTILIRAPKTAQKTKGRLEVMVPLIPAFPRRPSDFPFRRHPTPASPLTQQGSRTGYLAAVSHQAPGRADWHMESLRLNFPSAF